jgi:hypothetical protein
VEQALTGASALAVVRVGPAVAPALRAIDLITVLRDRNTDAFHVIVVAYSLRELAEVIVRTGQPRGPSASARPRRRIALAALAPVLADHEPMLAPHVT